MKIFRDHDKLYLNENYKEIPKESTKFIVNNALKFISSISNPTVLDVGCATGDLIYYLQKNYLKKRPYIMLC